MSTNIRTTKRKLDDAFQILDNAVAPTDHRPPPSKRSNTSHSLYSTLAKYGIKSKEHSQPTVATPGKSTPHLTAILTRAATRTKNAFPFRFSTQPPSFSPSLSFPSNVEYRPSSLPSFLSRLSTFRLTTYANKPPTIDAVAAAKCGWTNDGKDRLVCDLCSSSWVVAGREGMNRDAANSLIERQRISLVEAHKNGCPWKTRQCDPSIYCIPLQSPAVMVRDVKAAAMTLNAVLEDVTIKHPLNQSQLSSLRTAVASFKPPMRLTSDNTPNGDDHQSPASSPEESEVEPSETAILTALFGWTLVKSAPLEASRRPSTVRTSSAVPFDLASPSVSKSVSRPATPPSASKRNAISFQIPSNLLKSRDSVLLQCNLCQRRIGLWAFAPRQTTEQKVQTQEDPDNPSTQRPRKPVPQRPFDLLKEHRSYCPYVVRSTVVPSMPIPVQESSSSFPVELARSTTSSSNLQGVNGALDGWRAVLTVVLRYGMAQRQMAEYNIRGLDDAANTNGIAEPMEVDNVKAMVAGVKSKGGKDLLKYVRGLLG